MPKQLLIYESAVPVSAARHAGICVEPQNTYAFSAGLNAVPLMAVEFMRASAEYAIVFTAEGDEVMPAVVLGIRGEENLYLTPEGRWRGNYIPAFIRRYPFVFSAGADGKTLNLCIDETHPGVNRDGRGSALFSPEGKPTSYVEKVLEFLKEFQLNFERTRLLGRRLKALDLLEPTQANVSTPDGSRLTLSGFLVVGRDRLRGLPGDVLQELARSDALELLYLHLASLRNLNEVKDRLVDVQAAQAVQGAQGAPQAEVLA